MEIARQFINDAKKYVPLFAFQRTVPSIDAKRKKPFIEHLKEENPGKLINLVEFWKINRYRNLFLYRLPMKARPTVDIISGRLDGLCAGSRENELVYEVIRTNINSDVNDIYVFLKVRSKKKHFKSEEPAIPYRSIELDHRKPYYINAIFSMQMIVFLNVGHLLLYGQKMYLCFLLIQSLERKK